MAISTEEQIIEVTKLLMETFRTHKINPNQALDGCMNLFITLVLNGSDDIKRGAIEQLNQIIRLIESKIGTDELKAKE